MIDTSLHLLGNCCAIAEKWCEFFGRYHSLSLSAF